MSDVLDTIRLRGAVFFLWEPSAPYGVGVADGEELGRYIMRGTDCVVSYHIVTRGPCWAAVRGEEIHGEWTTPDGTSREWSGRKKKEE